MSRRTSAAPSPRLLSLTPAAIRASIVTFSICNPGGAPGNLLATGSEVSLCKAACEQLIAESIWVPVVSPPSWELFEEQSQACRTDAGRRGTPRLHAGAGDGIRPDGAPFATDDGHHIPDCAFGPIPDPADLAASLRARAGIVAHGLLLGLATDLIVAGDTGISHRVRP